MNKGLLLLTLLAVMSFVSCEKYREFDNLEERKTSFTGVISVTESVGDLDGIYSGSGDSGTYSFVWDNPAKGAVLSVENLTGSGTIQFILKDSKGDEVMNEGLNANESNAFAKEGKKGKWLVEIIFTDYSGEGTFDLNPIQ